MPRGVIGSGPYAGRKRVKKPKAKAAPAAAAVVAAVAPPAAVVAAVAAVVAAATPAAAPQPDIADTGPLGSVNVDDLSGESLKRYALRAGVHHRDVAGLTEDRLRQNVKLVIAEHFELILEG